MRRILAKIIGLIIFLLLISPGLTNNFYGAVTDCTAEDDENKKGLFSGVCDDPSGSYLESDEGTVEDHTYGKNLYAGVRIQSVDASVTSCSSIDKVELCYEWWVTNAGGGPIDCDVSVDADGGASYSAVTTTCPGTTANPGIICTDITALETWSCSNFFGADGTRACAKSEVTRVVSGKGSVETASWDALFFNVTYTSTAFVDITLQFSSVSWSNLNPNTVDNPGVENSNSGYIVTVESATNVNIDLYVKGDDLISGSYSIGVGNMSWNTVNNPAGSTLLTNAYVLVASNQAPGANITGFFWLDVPSGQTALSYTGTVYFKAVETGQAP